MGRGFGLGFADGTIRTLATRKPRSSLWADGERATQCAARLKSETCPQPPPREMRAGFPHDPRRGGFARRDIRLAFRNLAAVTFDGSFFCDRRVRRHDDERRDSAPARRQRQRSRMIARRGCDDPVASFLIGERKDCICRAAYFERARFLGILTLEIEARSGDLIERCRRQDRRAVDSGRDSAVRSADRFDIGNEDLSLCRHGTDMFIMAHLVGWKTHRV